MSCWSFLMLEATTLFLHERSNENMRLCVLINLRTLNRDVFFHLFQLHLRQEIPPKLFYFQNTYNCYRILPHLIDWFIVSFQEIIYISHDTTLFHGPALLNITILCICLTSTYLSVLLFLVSLWNHKELAATMCPLFVIKDTGFQRGKQVFKSCKHIIALKWLLSIRKKKGPLSFMPSPARSL